MHKLAEIIHEIYNKYLPLAQSANISLNLDFPDPTQTIKSPEKVKKALDIHLSSAIKRTSRGGISISITPEHIIIRDTGTILSKTTRDLLENSHIKIKSRVGFGTTVTISLNAAT